MTLERNGKKNCKRTAKEEKNEGKTRRIMVK